MFYLKKQKSNKLLFKNKKDRTFSGLFHTYCIICKIPPLHKLSGGQPTKFGMPITLMNSFTVQMTQMLINSYNFFIKIFIKKYLKILII